MNEHDEAIARLQDLQARLNVPALTGGEPQRILQELVVEAIAVREHLKRPIDGGAY